MKMKLNKLIIISSLVLGLFGCTKDFVPSQPGAAPPMSSLDTTDWPEFESEVHGISIKYPTGWAIDGSGELLIYIAPTKDLLLSRKAYTVRAMKPYVKRGNQRLDIPQSTIEVAQALVETWTKTGADIINPVTNVDINGRDGVISLVEDNQIYVYTIVLRVAQHKVIILNATGSEDDVEEMQATLNAIALTVQPLEQ